MSPRFQAPSLDNPGRAATDPSYTNMMAPEWQPYREPVRSVILRTGAIAVLAGAAFGIFSGSFARWPLATVLALWPSFGGHWVEVWFLNGLRPRFSSARGVQVATRVSVWFIAGAVFVISMRLSLLAMAKVRLPHWHIWWLGGFAFIGIELIAHLVLQLRGRPNFYNGLG
jgi:hypothetical protein